MKNSDEMREQQKMQGISTSGGPPARGAGTVPQPNGLVAQPSTASMAAHLRHLEARLSVLDLQGLPADLIAAIATKRDRILARVRQQTAIAERAEAAIGMLVEALAIRNPETITALLAEVGDQEASSAWRRALAEHAAAVKAANEAEAAHERRLQEFHTRERQRQEIQDQLLEQQRTVAAIEQRRAVMEGLAADVERWGIAAESLRKRIGGMTESPELSSVITRSIERQVRNADPGHEPA